ncbi:MAG: type I restriction endonuclease subunit R, EcoR124 family, partial [Campylobacterota bacterium]
LKHHGLIQAFSRTNRVLNDTKPYGNILDFYAQQDQVQEAITMFSGKKSEKSKEIWLVKSAPVVIEEFEKAVDKLSTFMSSQGLEPKAKDVANIKGDSDRAEFINHFKEVQRLKTQLDQYTDLDQKQSQTIESIMPQDELRAFKGVYIDTAKRLKEQQSQSTDDASGEIGQLDFEFVLFASDVIDYDYIMNLIARYTQAKPKKQKMTKEQLMTVIESDAKFVDEKDDIGAYIDTLQTGSGLDANDIKKGYETFKAQKSSNDVKNIAKKYKLNQKEVEDFVNLTVDRKIFDAQLLTDVLEPLGLGWKERGKVEMELMGELIPVLKKMVDYQEISGLSAYEE